MYNDMYKTHALNFAVFEMAIKKGELTKGNRFGAFFTALLQKHSPAVRYTPVASQGWGRSAIAGVKGKPCDRKIYNTNFIKLW